MKKRGRICGGILLFTLMAMLAAAQGISGKTVTITGKVSDDGKTIVSDSNDKWSVNNADILKGHEGQAVRVKCRRNADKNQIEILSVKPGQSEMRYAANHGDSAFRR